jgi:hypothetical protein
MTTNGKNVLAIAIGVSAGILLAKVMGNKSFKRIYREPSLFQYLNRFSEFFDSEYIPEVQDLFFYLVDSGLSSDQAFYETINRIEI